MRYYSLAPWREPRDEVFDWFAELPCLRVDRRGHRTWRRGRRRPSWARPRWRRTRRARRPGWLIVERGGGAEPARGVTPGPVPVYAYGPGPIRCAEASVGIANATIIATPLKRCLMSLFSVCSSRYTKG